MTALFGHEARLTIWTPRPSASSRLGAFFGAVVPNAMVVERHRIQFAASKDGRSEPNRCQVVVTNLAAESRAELERGPKRVMLEFGYRSTGHLRRLFVGDLTHVAHEHARPEWLTTLTIADGSRAYRFARVNRALAAGTTALAAVREVAAALDLEVPVSVAQRPELQRQFATGLSMAGRAAVELTRLLEPLGLRWSIQDGVLVVLDDTSVTPGAPLLVDQNAGVIGSPVYAPPSRPGDRPVLTVRCLLFPEITPGGYVRVKTRSVSGDFRVESTSHEGSNFEDETVTTFEAKPL